MHEFRRHVLSPIGDWFQPTWHDSYTGKLVSYDPAQQQRTLGEVWEGYRSDMISTTAVSLLTESCSWNEPNFVFTEKTFFAVFGLTFPIWVGNHGQADQFEGMGFDTFPDVINHDYQFYPDLFDRVYWAIKLNLPLLTDIDLARTARRQHLPRLISNRAHLFGPEYLDWLISRYRDLDTTILQQLLCVPRQESALTVKLQHSLSAS